MVDKSFRNIIAKAGYRYIDWNVDSRDISEKNSKTFMTVVENVKKACKNKAHIVILMHDNSSMQVTANALSSLIEYLNNNGYSFKTL